MQSSFRIGNIFGIDVGIHYTWLIIFALVTWSLAAGFFPEQFPGWATSTYWIVGAIAAVLLFVSVLLHELAHSLVAKREGMPVHSITLFLFGGVSNIQKEARSPKDEFLMALVGPASSLVIGTATGVLWFLSSGLNQQIQATLLYLTVINILLAVFNLIPAFPLDGGRVFRAIIWWITNNLRQATRIAATVGQGFAFLLILGGLYWTFTGNIISGLWLVFIGWFLNNAADSSYRQMVIHEALNGLHVSDMMTRDVETVSPGVSVRELVERYILPRNVRALPVVQDSRLAGIVTLSDVQRVPQENWDLTLVEEIMTPQDKLHLLTTNDDAVEALEALGEQDINQLPVVDNGRIVGLVTRGNVIRVLQVREGLRIHK